MDSNRGFGWSTNGGGRWLIASCGVVDVGGDGRQIAFLMWCTYVARKSDDVYDVFPTIMPDSVIPFPAEFRCVNSYCTVVTCLLYTSPSPRD